MSSPAPDPIFAAEVWDRQLKAGRSGGRPIITGALANIVGWAMSGK